MKKRHSSVTVTSPSSFQQTPSWDADHAPPRAGPSTALDRWLATLVQRVGGVPAVRLVLWDGTDVSCSHEPPVGTVHLRNRPALLRLLSRPDLQFGELYVDGGLHIEGDLVSVMQAVYRGLREVRMRGGPYALLSRIGQPRRRGANSLRRSPRNIHHHYDLGNDFYRLWLDDQLVYTCAYFPDADSSLERAQIAKMDHVCSKLRLRPDEDVIEAGCGWGALALHMARRYGVRVRAYNISTQQVAYARQRARDERLADRVEFIEDDYRNITGDCDAFVSVGMLEHVGVDNYSRLGAVIDRCLRPRGRGLIHSIGRNQPGTMNTWIARRIFPGANPPSLGETAAIFEPYDFSILDVENLRLHYARTLEHWLDRYEGAVDQIRAMYDERFVRVWRLYLAGSIAAFASGQLQLFQIVFNRGSNDPLAMTRDYLYSREG